MTRRDDMVRFDMVNGIHKFGAYTDLDVADGARIIWSCELTPYVFETVDQTLWISSDVEGDTDIEVTLEGCEVDGTGWVEVVTTHTTDGRTFMPLTNTGVVVDRMFISGDTAPTGNIYLSKDNTDAGGNGIPDTVTDIKGFITAGLNQSEMFFYKVRAGEQLCLKNWEVTCGRETGSTVDRNVTVIMWQKLPGGVKRIVERKKASPGNSAKRTYKFAKIFPPLTEIWWTAQTDLDNTGVNGTFEAWRERV